MIVGAELVAVAIEKRRVHSPQQGNDVFTTDAQVFGMRVLGALLIIFGGILFVVDHHYNGRA